MQNSNFIHPVSFDVVLSSDYDVQVSHALTIRSHDGGKYTNVYWKILSGIHTGKIFHTLFNRSSENGENVFRIAKAIMGLPPNTPCNDEKLVGKYCRITVDKGPYGNSAQWFAPSPLQPFFCDL